MKCLKCGRPLKQFSVQIEGREGPIGWGPVCARSVVVQPERQKRPYTRIIGPAPRAPQPLVDPLQMLLEFA